MRGEYDMRLHFISMILVAILGMIIKEYVGFSARAVFAFVLATYALSLLADKLTS